jgi:hypothetical protein
MAQRLLLEQFHLSVFVPRTIKPAAADAARRSLTDVRFRRRLRRAVAAAARQHRALGPAAFVLSR